MAALPLRWRLLSRPLLPPPAPPHAAFWRRLLVSQPTTNANAVRCSSSSSTSTPSEREGQEQQPPRPKRPRPFRLALVGRPNVGKSTLFNRLTGGGRGWVGGAAIVTDVPGTTRDRKEGRCSFGGLRMAVVDTGGLEEEDDEKDGQGAAEEEGNGTEGDGDDDEGPQQQWRQREAARAVRRRMQALINAQVEAAVKESDAVLLVLDARAGVGPEEEHLARWLLRMGAKDKTLVVANKAEGGVLSPAMQAAVYDAYAFGFPADPVPISAAHNEGISELAGAVVELAKARGFAAAASDEAREEDEDNEQEDALTVAFIGLPNVGKSSLLNALLHGPSPSAAAAAAIADGEAGRYPRLIASEVAGTTRDAVLVDYEWRGRQLRLVDTAGIRKKGRWDHRNKLERLAVEEALRAVRYANVVVLVLDGQQLRLRRQEQAVADTAFKEGRALVVAANKSDLLASSPKAFAQGVRDQLQLLSPQLGSLPVVPVSALTGQGVGGLLPAIARAYRAWNTRVSTGTLNRWLLEVQRFRSPPLTSRGRVVKLKYITQVKTRPPTFALVANTREVDDSYVRFLKNKLQEEFVLHGMDVRLSIKSTSDNNPFAQSSPRRDNQQHNQQQRRSSGRKLGKEEDEDEEEARQRRREREAARAQAARKRDEARGSKTYRTRTVGR